ncbi:MAG: hypothetical protein AAGL23_06945 [Pseudomonadota bacterium]
MKGFRIGVMALALLCASPVLAADILGTSLVDGRKVEILSDGTWRFSEPLPEDCTSLTSQLLLCATDGKWIKVAPATADITAQFRHNDTTYALVIVEDIGAKQGLTNELMREIVLDNAAAAIGFDREDVSVVSVDDTQLFGKPAETLSYFMEIDGLPVLYRNTVLIDADQTVQALTYEVATELTAAHTTLHAEYLEELRWRE